jgi:hypothetical protein
VDEHGVFGTLVQVELSGAVWKLTVALRDPVAVNVIRQFTHGLSELTLLCPVWVELPVNEKLKLQSGVIDWASTAGGLAIV